MSQQLKLMCVLAHPDDESFGTGSTLAKYSAEGVETVLVTATRGERGWFGDAKEDPGLAALGKIREAELHAAAQVLGIHQVRFLDYIDGDLDQADPLEAVAQIVAHVRRVRPQVVVTFGPDGSYGHPDHIAISQFTATALVCAADADYGQATGLAPYRVPKLYYKVWTKDEMAQFESMAGPITMPVDGVERGVVGWDEWAITTWVETEAYWRAAREAAACHQTQRPGYVAMLDLPDERHRNLWRRQGFYRVYSTVNGGRRVEDDLFEGLR